MVLLLRCRSTIFAILFCIIALFFCTIPNVGAEFLLCTHVTFCLRSLLPVPFRSYLLFPFTFVSVPFHYTFFLPFHSLSAPLFFHSPFHFPFPFASPSTFIPAPLSSSHPFPLSSPPSLPFPSIPFPLHPPFQPSHVLRIVIRYATKGFFSQYCTYQYHELQ